MTNKKRLSISILCLLMLIVSMFAFSSCGGGKVENFNLSFKVDGESYSTISTNGAEVVAIPENPTKEGYTFDGWYWDEDVWSKPFTANSLMDAPISSDMSIYAKFSAIKYEITYENDGGMHSNPVSYTIEDSFALSAAERPGYTFVGWYSDAAYTTKVESVSEGSKGAITLYAKFEINNYTISYGNTKDVANSNVTSYNVNTDTIILSELSKTGYVFEGWYNGDEKVTEIAKGSTGNITFTAKWSVIGYDITYHNVDGATNSNPASYDVEDQPLSLSDASKDGYRFLGWYTDAAFTNKISEIAIGTTGDVTLYAKWEAIEYTATFMDGNTVVGAVKFTVESESITEPSVPEHVGYTGAWESYTLGTENITVNAVYTLVSYVITYNNVSGATNNNPSSYNVEDQPLVLVESSKDHYTFIGWYSDAAFTNQITEIAVGTTGPIELYAKWEAVEYTITFLYDNAIGDYAEGTTVKTTYIVEDEFEFATLVSKTVGYTFDGWYTEKNVGTGTKVTGVTRGTSGNITVYAQFGLEEYDIIYNNVNGATNNNPTYYAVESDDFTIYPLTKEGYTFDGWFTNEECTTPANLTITKGSSGDITLYAKWTPITYTIEYVTYGGTATGNPTTYIVTDNIIFNNATLSGYVFKGWYTAAEGGSKITGITTGTTGNIILYAHWDYVSTITFETNGGSPVNSISNVEGTAISAPTAPTKEHYAFAGWYSDAALKNAYSFTAQPAEDITLYAKWTPFVYEIEYVLNGGTNSKNNVTKYTVEDKIELHAPSKVGYDFIGWFTDAEFTSSVVTELKVGTSGKITLYAHYSVNQYTISFESNGGTSVAPIMQNYATNVTAPEAPSKNGYTFAGWYSNASLTSKYTFSTMPADNITLYAKWNLETYNITYNLNGGTNNSSNPATYTITSAKITLKDPTKTGYSFAGWYTDAECTEVITEIASGSYGVVELFAKWAATEYTITYVTADGAIHSNILTYTIETDLTTLADATLKGHTFGGWYTNSSYTTAVTTVAGGETGNKTVYAKFTANTYNVWLDGNEEASCVVSFNLNGAEGVVASQTVTPTATLKYPTLPTRDGYIFAGWYTNADCTGSLYDFTAVVTSDTTLYAKWVKVENATAIQINGNVNVTLNGKYEQMLTFVPLVSGNITITSSGNYDTFGVLYNSEMVALAQDDDNASNGKNFLIVYNVTAGETYYIGARAFSSTTTGTATVSIAGSTTVLDGGYAITASKGSATYGQNFTLNVPNARDGYKFLGYADENGVMYTDANGNSVKAWDKDEETTLYSEWERTVYTVTFVTSGGTPIDSIELAYGERLDIGKYVTTRSGYSFTGWYLDGSEFNATTMPDHNITLTAYWKTFALGSIKYDVDKLAISVDDEITAELFSALCLDTNGNLATFTVTVSGTKAAGETISVRLVATSGNKTKQITITGIKVYGAPTLTFDNTVDYFNIKDGLTASWFGASGTDSFGNATTIRVYVDYDYEAGKYVTVTIESIDPAGNKTYGYIENVKAYGLPEITYNENKTSISVNDTLNAELFGASAKDSFGEPLTVTVSKYSGTISTGKSVTIRISATDSKGNVTNIDVLCKVYGAPTISSATKTDVKVSDEITPELLGITATDTYGQALDVILTVENGTQTAGRTMTVTANVTDIAGNVTTKDYTLKIYGTPTITYSKDAIKVTDNAESNVSILNAVAVDSFGNSLTVTAKLSDNSTFVAGNYVTYILTASDRLGNVATLETAQIGVYDVNDINLTYSAGMSDLIKLTSKGEEFDAKATDSFGNACDITIEAAKGYTLSGGKIISLYIVATDKAGNKAYSDIIENIKVYGMPNVEINEFIYEDTDINFIATVKDSFGEELYADITWTGMQKAGEYVYVIVKAEDDAGNIIENTYTYRVVPDGCVYTLKSDGTYELTSYTGTDSEVEIWSTYKEIEVTSIAANAFKDNAHITSVTIPDSITSISSSAFSNCTSLESITLPFVGATKNGTSNTHFGYIFGASSYDKNSSYVPSSLKTVVITGGTSIGSSAFYGCTSLTSIEIPDSVTSIGSSAFYVCTNLERITLPFVGATQNGTSNTHFGYIFGASDYGNNSSYVPSSLKTVVITGGTGIGSSAFAYCRSLTSVTIPDSVTSIGSSAFRDCTSLTSVTIPASVTSIDSYAFGNCTSLTSVTFGDNSQLTSIDYEAFKICTSLTSIEIPASVTSIDSYAFAYCTSLTSVTFGDNSQLTSIDSNAFWDCTSLTSIEIPASVTSIGQEAFGNCSSLTSVTFGDNSQLTSISSSTFYGCTSLTSVTIPNSITSIGQEAFYSCTSLTSIEIPDSVTSIGGGAFDGCTSLTSIKIPASVTSISYSTFAYCTSLTSIEILDSVTSIGGGAFKNCTSLTSVTIGNSVTSIGSRAFYGCTSLTSIEIPASVTSIGQEAFRDCTSLTSVTFGDNSQLTSIDYDTFENCTSLTSIEIPASVTSISSSAFENCTSLEEIYFNATAMNDLSSDVFYSAGKDGEGINVTIGKNVTRIPAYLFDSYDNSPGPKIISLNFEKGSVCDGIGSYAFRNCTSLTSVYITDIAAWCGISFGNSSSNPLCYAKNLYLNGELVTDLVIPDSVTSINSYAFRDCTSLTSIEIPASVTSIGSSAFYGCTSLESITLPFVGATKNGTSNTLFGYIFGAWSYDANSSYVPSSLKTVVITGGTSIGSYAFRDCTSLTSVTIPNSITSIGREAFRDCTSLTSIEIPASVTSIGQEAFRDCTSLTSVTFGDNSQLTSIDYEAFDGCTSLTSIEIPDSVTSIGSSAFYGCTSLTSVTFGDNSQLTSIDYDAFKNCTSLTSVTIGNSVTSIGSRAFYGCTSLTSITFKDTSTWYKTTDVSDWSDKTGGTSTSVTNSSTNATYFQSTYCNYYWYKL